MTEQTAHCQKCKQSLPSEAKFCPYCGIDLSTPWVRDYTQCSYTELILAAKRIEVAMIKDERLLEQFIKKLQDGSFKLSSWNKTSGMSRAEIIETIKQDLLGYKWAPGGLIHPMLNELVRIKEELNRRERIEDHQQIERFIREFQKKD